MKLKKKLKQLVGFIGVTSLLANLLNCSEESLVQPDGSQYMELITRKTSELTFLKAKNFSLAKVFNVTQLITSANGGAIEIGDDSTGISRIVFNAGDVDSDLNVSFWWDSQGFEADFGPHGSQFNNPVVVRLSYKDADLNGVVEDSLRIWYYNENDELWEMSGQLVNKNEKYVEGSTTHFSRFALGAD